MKKLLFIIICSTLLFSCGNNVKKTKKATTETSVIARPPIKEYSLRDKLPIQKGFTAKYKIISQTDIGYKNKDSFIPRFSVRVVLPKGLTKKDIINNFRKIVLDTYEDTNVKNISIFAYYKESEANGAYTVAMYEFCPYGNWSRTDECHNTPTESYEENFYISPSYFAVKSNKETPGVGDYVILKRERKWSRSAQKFIPASNTLVSNNQRDFTDENVKNVKNGTKAKILDIYSERLSANSMWVVYKIKTSNNITGWVYMEDTLPVK